MNKSTPSQLALMDAPDFSTGDTAVPLSDNAVYQLFFEYLQQLGPRRKVLVIPPDGSRSHARAGILLKAAYDYFGSTLKAVLPALGTHRPMTTDELARHFPGIPSNLFVVHEWRKDLLTTGIIPSAYVRNISDGLCDFEWPAQLNRIIVEGGFDLILSLGQVVPHEVVGMANYSKNLFIGAGGREGIALSHWLGAVWGLERTMGHIDTPVRALLDYAQQHFAVALPVIYALTVVGPENPAAPAYDGVADCVQGLFIGASRATFEAAAKLSADINITYLTKPAETVVVWLDPGEYTSTWLGNKAIYRSRLAIADGGQLVIMAPGIECFGEDAAIDQTIRQYGYCGTPQIRQLVENGPLASSLAAAAHLIHGSTEGRFSVEYGTGRLDAQAVEKAGYTWANCQAQMRQWQPERLQAGWNFINGQEIFFIRNPALGLWSSSKT